MATNCVYELKEQKRIICKKQSSNCEITKLDTLPSCALILSMKITNGFGDEGQCRQNPTPTGNILAKDMDTALTSVV